ncbi:hypothetical protein GCK72_021462 [Caenorhabditis remanei]|uniref:F-box domain-containing protein n=1 Tax=Caenorhabditis remanei TaxID=31234 RepID=A0A6A5GI78_CAERE|nr:hypothetical protein GCK72_021462 [Caenorhabditis remanei]KAF1754897.1 hypothetical protein GCK72_021462 [Caenorhabditis remanei]
MASQTLLVDFPAVIKSKVMENLDVFSILKLRKVCHNLREFIDQQPPKTNDTVIHLDLKGNLIGIGFKAPRRRYITYEQKENDCLVSSSTNEKSEVFKTTHFVDVFLKEFEIIMKHHWTPVLDSVGVDIDEEAECEKLYEMLNRLKCLHTKEVNFSWCNLSVIANSLPFFDAKYLDEIVMEECVKDKNSKDLNKITETKQWKSARSVKFQGEDFDLKIQDFIHFSEAVIECNSMPTHDIILLKESFLSTLTLTNFNIKAENFLDERDEIRMAFGHSSLPVVNDDEDDVDQKWFFRVPDSEKLLSITFTTEDRFIFQRIGIQDVPKGAVIKS